MGGIPLTEADTAVVSQIHWNYYLGFVAALVCLLALVPLYLFADATAQALAVQKGFGLNPAIYLLVALIYLGLLVAQIVITVRIFKRRAIAGVYVPGLVLTIANVVLAAISLPLLIAMFGYLYGGLL